MKIIITDTNVFFDIINIQSLPEFFALDFEICTIDLVIKEILESEQREQIDFFIRARKLSVFQLSEQEIDEIVAFQPKRFFKGITDKAVLWKAMKLKCALLTGDKKLRNEAVDQNIEVYGSIWVVKMLVKYKIIAIQKGIQFLEKLNTINDSLPHEDIDKLIKQYKQNK